MQTAPVAPTARVVDETAPCLAPKVSTGRMVWFWKRSADQPFAAFVTRVNVNGRVALSLIVPGASGLRSNSELMGIPHRSAPNAMNQEVNTKGYWDLTAEENRVTVLEEKVVRLESQIQQLTAAVTSPSGK